MRYLRVREGSQAEGADQGRERESTCQPGRLDLFCVPFPDTPFTSPPSSILSIRDPGASALSVRISHIISLDSLLYFRCPFFIAISGEGEQKALVFGFGAS